MPILNKKHIMAVSTFLLSFILGLLFLVGLISPKKVLRKSESPTRGKAFLFFGLPSIALFIAWGSLYESSWDEALKNPETATEVSLKYKKLEILPDELEEMTNIVSLDLAKNNLKSLPIYLKDFKNLETIDLAENPISELPVWLNEMVSLKELNLDNTQITSIPDGLSKLKISYQNTPKWIAENPEVESTTAAQNTDSSSLEDERSESLGEFALRKILDDRFDFKRKFKKGEIFYNDPVTVDQVDVIGEFMIMMDFFNDEREASMLLDQNRDDVFELKIVVVSEEALTEEVMTGFTSIKNVIKQDVFPDNDFHLVLTDDEFDEIKTIK